jgi:hypothetical protein
MVIPNNLTATKQPQPITTFESYPEPFAKDLKVLLTIDCTLIMKINIISPLGSEWLSVLPMC